MLSLRKNYATDRTAAEEGKWFKIRENLSVRVRRLNSDAVNRANVRITREFESHRMMPSKTFPEDISLEIFHRLMAEGVVVDWKGMTDEDEAGSIREVPYSAAAALEAFRAYPDFMMELFALAQDMANFREAHETKLLGN